MFKEWGLSYNMALCRILTCLFPSKFLAFMTMKRPFGCLILWGQQRGIWTDSCTQEKSYNFEEGGKKCLEHLCPFSFQHPWHPASVKRQTAGAVSSFLSCPADAVSGWIAHLSCYKRKCKAQLRAMESNVLFPVKEMDRSLGNVALARFSNIPKFQREFSLLTSILKTTCSAGVLGFLILSPSLWR